MTMVVNATNSPLERVHVPSVLLVEDDLADAAMVRLMLKRSRTVVELQHVTSLAEAEAHLGALPVDVIVLDMGLPDVAGFEGLERLEQANTSSAIVILTGDDDQSLALEALEHGADDFLVKGEIGGDVLKRSLRYAVARRRSRQLRDRLLQMKRFAALGQLAADVSHQINNPAGYIHANLEFLRLALDQLGDSQAAPTTEALVAMREAIDDSFEGLETIRKLIGEVNAYAYEGPRELCALSVSALLLDAVNTAELRAHPFIEIDWALAPEAEIFGDKVRLVQALYQLFVNAAEAIERTGSVTGAIRIESRVDQDWVQLLISDTGVGVAHDEIDKLLTPFHSSDHKRQGMGLTLAGETIYAHHGTISCQSFPGHGTTFIIELPRHWVSP